VAGFEPATPASRTQQTPPDTEQLQRLNETPDDGTEHENLNDLGPSFKSRSNSADSSEELGLPAPDAPEDAPAGFTPLPPNLLHGPSDEATGAPSEFRPVPLDAITIPDGRLRGVIEELMPAMTESASALGQIQPPTVRPDGQNVGKFELVCGRQRIEAARRMGLESILCRIVELSDTEAEMWEIDENLVRAALSPAQEALYMDKKLALHEELNGKAKAKGAIAANAVMGRASDASAKLADAFTKETAKKMGTSVRTVQRIVQRAALNGQANLTRVAGTSLDRKTELDCLAQLPPVTRETLIEQAEAGMDVSAVRERELLDALDTPTAADNETAAEPESAKDPDAGATTGDFADPAESEAAELEALKAAWLGASDSARAKYLQWLAETQNPSGVMPNTWIG
jgi:ParB/RepB/Spo0J family partition protein